MSLSVKNSGGGGNLAITNGILNEYYAQSGEIEAGTFVKIAEGMEGYITDLVNLLESNQTKSVSCVELSDNRVFITYVVAGSSSSVVYGVVVQHTSKGIVFGEVKRISSYSGTLNQYAPTQLISDNVVAVSSIYSSYNASYILCKIDGLSITISSTIMPATSTGFSVGSSNQADPLITVMNSTQFIVRHSDETRYSSPTRYYSELLIVKVLDGVLQSKKIYDKDSFSPQINAYYSSKGFNIIRISDTVFFMNRGVYDTSSANKFAFYSLDEDNNITLLKDIGTDSFPYRALVVWNFIKLKGYVNKYVMLYSDADYTHNPVKVLIVTIGDDYSFSSYTEPVVIHDSMIGYWHELFYNSDTENEFTLISKHYSDGIKAIKFSIDADGNVYPINDTVIPIKQTPLYISADVSCSESYKISEDKYRIYCQNPSYLEIDLSKEFKAIIPATSSANMIGFTKEKATTTVKGKIWVLNE